VELHAYATTCLHGGALNAFSKFAVPANVSILMLEGNKNDMIG
jgi:hypothetical protein